MEINVGVLALQGAVSEHYHHLRRCGAEARKVKRPLDLEGLSGLIIPGGESTAIGYLMRETGLDRAVVEKSRQGMALFGTCAGLALLASEVEDGAANQPNLGLMKVRVRRNAFGRQRESFETMVNVDKWEKPLLGVFIRAPVITEASAEVQVMARLEEGIIAARQGNMLVTSFHPELVDDLTMHHYFLTLCES